jgi:hypothetical protein
MQAHASSIPHSAFRTPHWYELHCALKTGYTVTSLSINNLAGYKSVTHQLHGYTVVNQQLSRLHISYISTDQQQIGNKLGNIST